MRSPVARPSAQPYSRTPLLALAALALAQASCEDLTRFSTSADESYCGSITLGSSFRRGFTPGTQMRLTLDASKIDGADSPGSLWTQELKDGPDPGFVHLLSASPLRPIPPVAHDVLSRPGLGEGRVRTAVYSVAPTDPAAESLVAFVSFRSDGDIEVRLLRPGAEGDPADIPEGRRPLFGLFTLRRIPGTCF